MKLGNSIVRSLLAVTGLVAAVACGPDYERTEISGVKQSPLGGDVTNRHVSVPEGMIVKANIVPFNDDQEKMHGHVFSQDPSVIEVIPVVNDRDFAFIGKKPGRTTITFQADDESVFVVQAEVLEQPEPPEPSAP
jgi:hypothetical protein